MEVMWWNFLTHKRLKWASNQLVSCCWCREEWIRAIQMVADRLQVLEESDIPAEQMEAMQEDLSGKGKKPKRKVVCLCQSAYSRKLLTNLRNSAFFNQHLYSCYCNVAGARWLWVPESSWQGYIWQGHHVSGEGHQCPLCHQDPQEECHHS